MKLSGPVRYKLTFDSTSFTVCCPQGTPNFSGIATIKLPKLYIASVDNQPIYVGITRQSIRTRLRMGWNATGESGYHGYAWRRHHTGANLDIWCHVDAVKLPDRSIDYDLETVEAEVVHLIRCAGQWPLFQTEIHFHPSNDEHRRVAAEIWKTFTPATNLK